MRASVCRWENVTRAPSSLDNQSRAWHAEFLMARIGGPLLANPGQAHVLATSTLIAWTLSSQAHVRPSLKVIRLAMFWLGAGMRLDSRYLREI